MASMNFDVTTYIERLAKRMKETEEEFIFETIFPYCEEILQIKISKQILINALMEYQENHPEEFIEKEDDKKRMTKEEAVKRLNEQGYIYGEMWGQPFHRTEGILIFNKEELKVCDDCFTFCIGYPGDYLLFYWDDYGITWSFERPPKEITQNLEYGIQNLEYGIGKEGE